MSLPFLDPGRVLSRADAARNRGDWAKAATYYRRYLRRRPSQASIWVQYGHALKESKRYAEAFRAYHKALELMPDDPDLHLQVGHLNKITGSTRGAIACYRKALELDPTLVEARRELDRLQHRGPSLDGLRMAQPGVQELLNRVRSLERRMDNVERWSASSRTAKGR